MKCPRCRRDIADTVIECPHCHIQVARHRKKKKAAVAEDPAPKPRITAFSVILYILLAISIAGWFNSNRQQRLAAAPPAATAARPPAPPSPNVDEMAAPQQEPEKALKLMGVVPGGRMGQKTVEEADNPPAP